MGQPLEIYNDDQTSHNIHPLAKVNAEWNKSQPPGAPPLKATYRQARVHPGEVQRPSLDARLFRGAQHLALRHDGRRRDVHASKGLPPGKYTVTAWHERFGTQSQEVTVGERQARHGEFRRSRRLPTEEHRGETVRRRRSGDHASFRPLIFISRVWWLPADISVLGVGIDRQMTETMIAAGVLFVRLPAGAGPVRLAVRRYRRCGGPSRSSPAARRRWC